jgi:hypothetical protein
MLNSLPPAKEKEESHFFHTRKFTGDNPSLLSTPLGNSRLNTSTHNKRNHHNIIHHKTCATIRNDEEAVEDFVSNVGDKEPRNIKNSLSTSCS